MNIRHVRMRLEKEYSGRYFPAGRYQNLILEKRVN